MSTETKVLFELLRSSAGGTLADYIDRDPKNRTLTQFSENWERWGEVIFTQPVTQQEIDLKVSATKRCLAALRDRYADMQGAGLLSRSQCDIMIICENLAYETLESCVEDLEVAKETVLELEKLESTGTILDPQQLVLGFLHWYQWAAEEMKDEVNVRYENCVDDMVDRLTTLPGVNEDGL
jgi:hypothetical protein